MRTHARLILACVLAALTPEVAPAQVTGVTVRVDGLSCPFCAYSLEKKLGDLAGVGDLVIDIAEGTASITPADDAPVDFAGLPRAVRDAGFTPRDIRARGVGRIEADGDRRRLVGPDGDPLFRLEPASGTEELPDAGDTLLEFEGTVVPPDGGDKSPPASVPKLSLATATPAPAAPASES